MFRIARTTARGLRFLRKNGVRSFLKTLYVYLKNDKNNRQEHPDNTLHFQDLANIEKPEKISSLNPSFVVIIPIYNGFDFLQNLRLSLANSAPLPLLLVDDHSTDPETLDLINDWSLDSNVKLIRNQQNLGFPGSVNRAIREIDCDFILLNSDTQVCGDWARKLMNRLYSDSRIAAVTPFSNSATIFSWPNSDNQVLVDSLEAISKASQINSGLAGFEAPSINGFCVAIRRAAWEKVGEFDEQTFKVGYGEENDWSIRARDIGYSVELAPDVFVYHYHGGSFSKKVKEERLRDSWQVLTSKYPNYEADVIDHIRRDPWRIARLRIEFQLAISRPLSIFVSHGIGGGAEVWLKMQEDSLKGMNSSHIVLTPGNRGCANISISYVVENGLRQVRVVNFPLPELLKTLNSTSIEHVTINSLVGWAEPLNFLETIEKIARIRYVAHDYFGICPSYNLLNHEGVFCGVPGTNECNECIVSNPRISSQLLNSQIEEWRKPLQTILSRKSSEFIYFSEDSISWFRRAGFDPANPLREEPKYLSALNNGPNSASKKDGSVRIAFVGHINFSKGSHVLREIVESELDDVEFHLIGNLRDSKMPKSKLTTHGRYSREDLPVMLKSLQIQLVVIPSIWPETYNIVSDEVLACGIPILVPPLGAMAERHQGNPLLFVTNGTTAKSYVHSIKEIFFN